MPGYWTALTEDIVYTHLTFTPRLLYLGGSSNISYRILNMDTLDKRRELLCMRFAKNCLRNEKMKRLFPLDIHHHNMKTRSQAFFKVNKARTSRYQKSTIPYLQKLLNADRKEKEKILT